MDSQSTATNPANGASTAHELFALTDEQILEIEPQGEVASGERRVASENRPPVIPSEARDPGNTFAPAGTQDLRQDSSRENRAMGQSSSSPSAPPNDSAVQDANKAANAPHESCDTEHGPRDTGHDAQAGVPVPLEPPTWLAAQMKDPWSGEEARELWNGVIQARQEAAAYRAAFATPEDARALRELYPGGVNEARNTVQRARILDDIDRAYFGAPGASPERLSVARTQLDDRARQLVPSAARRVINDWTQTTLVAHRDNAIRAEAASTRSEVELVAAQGPASQGLPASKAGPAVFSSRAAQARLGTDSRRLDYRKLSDEQILDL